jgi:hypothetical protein
MNKYVVVEGEDLTDIAVQLYGDALSVIRLAEDNNISIDDDLEAGQELNYQSDYKILIIDTSKIKSIKGQPIDYYEVIVALGQNLTDLAIQEYGDVMGVFDIMNDNNINNINLPLVPGQMIKCYRSKIINLDVVKQLKRWNAEVSTDSDQESAGINYMGIEINFKVS